MGDELGSEEVQMSCAPSHWLKKSVTDFMDKPTSCQLTRLNYGKYNAKQWEKMCNVVTFVKSYPVTQI